MVPTAPRISETMARCVSSSDRGAYTPVAPAPLSAGRFGIARATATPGPHQPAMSARRMPAAMDNTSGLLTASAATSVCVVTAMSCGFTASTTTAAPSTASRLSAVTRTPSSSASWLRRACCASPTLMFCGARPRAMSPRISAPPMFPPPMKAALMVMMVAIIEGF
jgi:hypothetical protein